MTDEYYEWHQQDVTPENIPVALKALDQWVCWKAVPRPNGQGMNKIPCQPTGRNASSTDPGTWNDFDAAYGAYDEEDSEFAGVGFVLSADDQFVGIDFDHCRNPVSGEIKPQIKAAIERLGSYAEVSPSGTGIRVIVCGQLPQGKQKNATVELYQSGRFLTMTGATLGVGAAPVVIDEQRMRALRDYFIPEAKPRKKQSDNPVVTALGEKGLLQRQSQPGVWEITCPWSDTHTGGDISGTKYLEANFNGHSDDRFFCHHAHCDGRKMDDLLAFLGLKEKEMPRLRFMPLREIRDGLQGAQYLIKPFLERNTTTVIFGESGAFKSFLAVDIALSVAYGKDFHGHKSCQGPVFYIAGEGMGGMGRRIESWLIERGHKDQDAPFYLSTAPAALFNAGNAEAIAEIIEQYEEKPAVVVIDTLSTNFGDGDESSNPDIAKLLVSVNLHIRDRFKCCVAILHHVGHGDKDRERGAYAIRANADGRILVRKDSDTTCSIHCLKSKDAPEFLPVAFSVGSVDIPGIFDSEGEQVSSLVLTKTEYISPEPKDAVPAVQKQGLSVLEDMHEHHRLTLKAGNLDPDNARVSTKEWRDKLLEMKVIHSRAAFYRMKHRLQENLLVVSDGDYVTPC